MPQIKIRVSIGKIRLSGFKWNFNNNVIKYKLYTIELLQQIKKWGMRGFSFALPGIKPSL